MNTDDQKNKDTLRRIAGHCDEVAELRERFGEPTIEALRQSSLHRNAAAMSALQIAERASELTEDFDRALAGEVSWHQVIRMRGIAINGEHEIDTALLEDACMRVIPQLGDACRRVLDQMEQPEPRMR